MEAGGERMYKKMYLRLFNAVTDVLAHIDEHNYGIAKEMLIEAQQACEEIYMEESQEEE